MKTRSEWKTCVVCDGKRFVTDRPAKRHEICPECGGDGCSLFLVGVERTADGMRNLIDDLADAACRRE